MNEDVFVAVRSVGERTEDACLQIAKGQVNSETQIHLIKNKPFSEAQIESIEKAIESKARWALFLDADILLIKDAISIMRSEAESVSFPFYQINFKILDYGFGGETFGVHFYSTEYFEQALNYRDIARSAQRPEYQFCYEIANKAGIPSVSSKKVAALHGYHQYYGDLYRTSFVRAIKYHRHQDYMFRFYTKGYFNDGGTNMDMKFLFWGLIDGMIFGYDHEKAALNSILYQNRIDELLAELNINEKEQLDLPVGYVEDVISNHVHSKIYLKNIHWICPDKRYTVSVPDRSLKGRLRKIIQPILSRMKRSIKVLLFG